MDRHPESADVLPGGNASRGEVVRVGDTVRKPWTASTPSVIAYVEALRSAGIDAPKPLGRDDNGRQVQEFVPGVLAMDAGAFSRADLRRVGAMVRAIHDASANFTPPESAVWQSAIPAPAAEVICHNDLAPWNLIVGDRWVFVDWDAAAPSTRLWDLAYAAQAFALGDASRNEALAAGDLAAFVDGYAADHDLRMLLPQAMIDRTAAMLTLLRTSHETGVEPWATMFTSGHGAHWAAAHDYVQRHRRAWVGALRGSGETFE